MKLLALVAILTAACGGGSSHGYATLCTTACNPGTSGACAGMDPTPCVNECEARTDGTSTTCAQCIIDDTGWRGTNGTAGPMCANYVVGSAASTHCAPLCK